MQIDCVADRAAFQSTPLREGRHVPASTVARLDRFQSTPLREGRRTSVGTPARCALMVSIHAPA